MLPKASYTVPSSTLAKFVSQIQSEFEFNGAPNDLATQHDEYLTKVHEFSENVFHLNEYTGNDLNVLKNSLSAVVYLLAAIEISHSTNSGNKLKAFTLNFKSEIRAGAGTGSSAAFSVSTASAFYVYAKLRDDPSFIDTYNGSNECRQDIYQIVSSWAFLSERIIHKTPSGLDNTVCTFGNVVRFIKQPREIAYINPVSTISVILVDTGVSRDTAKVVGGVRKLYEQYPTLIGHIFDGMGEIVTLVIEVCTIG